MKPSANKLAMTASFLTLTAFALSVNCVPPLATTIAEDFEVNYSNFGFIFMAQFLFFTAASFIGGWTISRFSVKERTLVCIGIIFSAIALGLGAILQNLGGFIVWAIPVGFFGGLVETFCSIMLCKMSSGQSSKIMNLSQSFYSLGAIIVPFLIACLLFYNIHWRYAFLIIGLTILLIGILFIISTRQFKFETPITEEPNANASEKTNPQPVSIPPFKDPLLYFLCAGMFLYVAVEGSTICWMSAYFEKHLHLSAPNSASQLGLFWIGVIVGRLGILILPKKLTLWPALIVGAIGMLMTYLMISFTQTPYLASVGVVLCGIASGPLWPTIVSLSQSIRKNSTFTSLVIGAGSLGAAIGPFLSSKIITVFDMSKLFPALAIGSFLLLISIWKAKSISQKDLSPKL
jgi:fucose permease